MDPDFQLIQIFGSEYLIWS